jgi:Predicted nucleotide-binding protein containing TIR-like domain
MARRRVFISLVADALLSDQQNDFKWAVVERIQKLGFQPEIFYNPRSVEGVAARKSWTPADAEDVIQRCVGGVIIGMPRWHHFDKSGADVWMASEYAQYEGAMLKVAAIPLLILVQDNIKPRGIFEYNFGQHVRQFPADVDGSWLASSDFQHAIDIWLANIGDRRDIFLGYCSSSANTAAKIRDYIESELDTTILDWKRDFSVARTVLEEIAEAAGLCSGGIFLFTRDDTSAEPAPLRNQRWFFRKPQHPEFAIPRDNVVFEAGFFIGMKGKRRILVVREEGTKMPADLGADVYAALEDKHDIGPIKEVLKRFILSL